MKFLLQLCRFDILAITETHLDINVSNRQLEIENYKIARRDRNAGTLGGGCLVYIANHICSTRMKSLECPTIEGVWLRVNINPPSLLSVPFTDHLQVLISSTISIKHWKRFGSDLRTCSSLAILTVTMLRESATSFHLPSVVNYNSLFSNLTTPLSTINQPE